MRILFKWIMRYHRSDRLRVFTIVFGIMCEFAAITCLSVTIHSCIQSLHTDGKGAVLPIFYLLIFIILMSPGPMLYVSTTIEERSSQYRILIASGRTIRQILSGIFVECASVLLCGTIPGVAAGYALSWFLVDKKISVEAVENFRFECSLPDLLRVVVSEYLFVLFIMLCNALYIILSRKWHDPTLENVSNRSISPTCKRVFGVGGVIGSYLRRNERIRTTTCMPSLVLSVLILIVMVSVFITINEPHSIDAECNVKLMLSKNEMLNGSFDSFEDTNAAATKLILSMQKGGQIQNAICSRRFTTKVFLRLPDELLYPKLKQEQKNHPFFSALFNNRCLISSGNSGQIILPDIIFYDADSFKSLAEKNNISPDESNALFYNAGICAGNLMPILSQPPDEPVMMHFFEYKDLYDNYSSNTPASSVNHLIQNVMNLDDNADNSGDSYKKIFFNVFFTQSNDHTIKASQINYTNASDFLNNTKPVASQPSSMSMQIAGLLQSPPPGAQIGSPALVFSEKLFDQLQAYLKDGSADSVIYFDIPTNEAQDRNDLVNEICNTLCATADCDVRESIIGLGSVIHSWDSHAVNHFSITDLQRGKVGMMNYLRLKNGIKGEAAEDKSDSSERSNVVQVFYLIVIGLPFTALFANTLIIAHLNRSVRRREYATLSVLGIKKKQEAQMHLYESLLYGLHSVLYSIPFFLLLIPLLFVYLSFCLSLEHAITIDNLGGWGDVRIPSLAFEAMMKSIRQMLQLLWICIPAIVIIFLVFLFSTILVKKVMQRGELICILKETPYK